MSLDSEIWTSKECADYLKVTPKHFLRHYRWMEHFPKPLPWSAGGRPRWSAAAVKAWALGQDYATAA